MFFIMGISQGNKELDFSQTIICEACGRYGRYEVFMSYTYLSLFFIPLFKWDKHYYVRSSCCKTLYELDPEKGRAIAEGRKVTINSSDLVLRSRGNGSPHDYEDNKYRKICPSCGYSADPDFEYCPKCGKSLNVQE